MKTHHLACHACMLTGLLCLAAPSSSSAQPNTGQFAAGGEVGIFLPSDDQLDGSLIGGGFFEYYFTPRLSIRGSLSETRPSFERGTDERERQLRVGGDVIYNWERGKFHPFAGGGLGLHHLRFHDRGLNVEPNDTNVGVSGLGGVEVFLNRAWTFKMEGRYQWVDDRQFSDPDGLALTFGIKRYF